MGFWCLNMATLGAIPPPPPFLSISPLESRRNGVRYPPPPQKGYLSDTCAIPYENKAKRVRCPPSAILSRKGIARYGGVSRIGAAKLKFPIRLILLSDHCLADFFFPPLSLMKFVWWSWASGYQTNLSLCFVGKLLPDLFGLGKIELSDENYSPDTFLVF